LKQHYIIKEIALNFKGYIYGERSIYGAVCWGGKGTFPTRRKNIIVTGRKAGQQRFREGF